MQLTQQIKINVTADQKAVLWKLSEKCRLIYNFALDERKKAFDSGKEISYLKQQNDLPKIKTQFPEYGWVYSKVLQYVLRTLDSNYKSYKVLSKKDPDANPPKFRGKNYFFTMVYNQSGFKCYDNKIRLSHKYNNTALEFSVPPKFKFGKIYQISVYEKDKQFYLSITYEQPAKKFEDNGLYQAFDLGTTKHTAVNLAGKFVNFTNARPDKYWKSKIQSLQCRRDRCLKFSRRWTMFNTLLNKCKRKSSNQLKDFQHKLSRKIVDNTKANTIVVGDLSIKKLCKIHTWQKSLHSSLHNTGCIARFVSFLTYKAKLVGKRVIENSEVNTSKMCYVCGKMHDMPLDKRIMDCDCGNVIDRDENSSINIMVKFLSQNGLWTACQALFDNLRQTVNGKMKVLLNQRFEELVGSPIFKAPSGRKVG